MFRQRVLNGDLVCNFRIDYGANGVAKGPCVEVKYWRKFVSDAEIVHHRVRMAFRRESLHELANSWKMAEPEAEGRLRQSIESASVLVESNAELYNEDCEKQEHYPHNDASIQVIYELNHEGE